MKILVTGGAGYIGSALCPYLRKSGHDVTICDVREHAHVSRWRMRYQELTANSLMGFDAVVHLAAHSSVKAAQIDPRGAVENNLTGVLDLVGKLRGQKFLIASTGSVYDKAGIKAVYDATKRAADEVLPLLYNNLHIMRFGTVCGVSPVMRDDLLLNGMTRNAVRDGQIWVANEFHWRPVLCLSDLCERIEALISGNDPHVIQDMASECRYIGFYAEEVSRLTGAKLVFVDGKPTYDFEMPIKPGHMDNTIAELIAYWRAYESSK